MTGLGIPEGFCLKHLNRAADRKLAPDLVESCPANQCPNDALSAGACRRYNLYSVHDWTRRMNAANPPERWDETRCIKP